MNKNRGLLIILTCFLSFFITINNVYADEICTKSKKYEQYEKLSPEEKKKAIEPEYCEVEKEERALNASSKPAKYNARSYGIVNTPKDQGKNGTCWAFSAMSVVETNSMKNKMPSYNFSEAHLVYGIIAGGYSDSAGKFNKYSMSDLDGGTLYFAPTYFFNNKGMLLENEFKYSKSYKTITNSQYPQGRAYLTVGSFELFSNNYYGVCSTSDINTIKDRILSDGSVQATMYMDSNLFKDKNKDFYLANTNNSYYGNHAVTIVGWDDTISKSNFRGAKRNGAWIVKNSWGSTWSGDGYFYISYDDEFICSDLAFYSGVTNKTFNNTYKTAEMVGGLSVKTNSTKVSVATIIKTNKSESIKRVSFAVNKNQNYNVYLSKSMNKDNKADWILLGSGYASLKGIKSVDLSNKIIVNSDYMIIVEYTSGNSDNIYMPMMCNNGYTSNTNFYQGVNFRKVGNESWADMYTSKIGSSNYKCSPNIYVYTDNEILPSSISVNKTSVEIEQDETETLTVTYNPSNTTIKDIAWVSSDNNIATVKNGVITGVNVGNAIITGTTVNGRIVKVNVKVNKGTMKVRYSTHVQKIGWQDYFKEGNIAGTTGRALRMEAIKIEIVNPEYSGNIEYRTHIQTFAWEKDFKKNNEQSGTTGLAKRLEAIEIRLTGELAEHYDVYYQVHAQKFGWLGWAKNGEPAGTAGYAYRLEGIIIKLVPKNDKVTLIESNKNTFYEKGK